MLSIPLRMKLAVTETPAPDDTFAFNSFEDETVIFTHGQLENVKFTFNSFEDETKEYRYGDL